MDVSDAWTKHNCGLREGPNPPVHLVHGFKGFAPIAAAASASIKIQQVWFTTVVTVSLEAAHCNASLLVAPGSSVHNSTFTLRLKRLCPWCHVSSQGNFMGAERDWTSMNKWYFVWVWMTKFHGHLWCLRGMMIAESIMPVWHSGMRNRPETPTTQLQSLRSEMVGHFVATPSW